MKTPFTDWWGFPIVDVSAQLRAGRTERLTMTEQDNLIKAANEAFVAFYNALLYAPNTPEFNRLKEINDQLRQAIVHAKNAAVAKTEQQ